MENKQSSVEWLYEKLFHCEINIFEWQNYLEQAKAMHKEEIIDVHGEEQSKLQDDGSWKIQTAEQYYNLTYGGNK